DVEVVHAPVAVQRLVTNDPFQCGSDGRLGAGVATAFADHLFARRTAPAAEAAGLELGTAHAARESVETTGASLIGVRAAALAGVAAEAGGRGNRHGRTIGGVQDADGLVRVDRAGHADFLDAVHVVVGGQIGIVADLVVFQVGVLDVLVFDLRRQGHGF